MSRRPLIGIPSLIWADPFQSEVSRTSFTTFRRVDIDKGNTAAATVSSIDGAGEPLVKNGVVDVGVYAAP